MNDSGARSAGATDSDAGPTGAGTTYAADGSGQARRGGAGRVRGWAAGSGHDVRGVDECGGARHGGAGRVRGRGACVDGAVKAADGVVVKAADGEVTAAGGRRPREQAFWARAPLGPGGDSLDLLTARFDRHRYAPHYHEEFTVGVGVGGCEVIDYRGGRVDAGPGSIVVLAAGEVHTGGPAALGGYAYRAMYPLPSLLAEGTATPPHFREAVVDDPELAAALRAAHTELSGARGRVDPLEAESRVPWLLTALARRHGAARPLADRVPGADHIARAVRERLADELLAPPSLAELAAPLGLSRYQLLRAFRTSTGLPPYAWLAQYRVTRARAHLDAGLRPAEAASLVGFADQAHLTRWFRRVLGVTPAAYRNSVQDAGRRRGADSRHDGTRLVPLLTHGGPVGHPVSHDQGGGRQ